MGILVRRYGVPALAVLALVAAGTSLAANDSMVDTIADSRGEYTIAYEPQQVATPCPRTDFLSSRLESAGEGEVVNVSAEFADLEAECGTDNLSRERYHELSFEWTTPNPSLEDASLDVHIYGPLEDPRSITCHSVYDWQNGSNSFVRTGVGNCASVDAEDSVIRTTLLFVQEYPLRGHFEMSAHTCQGTETRDYCVIDPVNRHGDRMPDGPSGKATFFEE